MQYVVSIATRQGQVIKMKEGRTQERLHVRVTHVPVHNRKAAELIANAINESTTGFRMGATNYDAEVGVRLFIRKGTLVLTLDELERIATEANNVLSASDPWEPEE